MGEKRRTDEFFDEGIVAMEKKTWRAYLVRADPGPIARYPLYNRTLQTCIAWACSTDHAGEQAYCIASSKMQVSTNHRIQYIKTTVLRVLRCQKPRSVCRERNPLDYS